MLFIMDKKQKTLQLTVENYKCSDAVLKSPWENSSQPLSLMHWNRR